MFVTNAGNLLQVAHEKYNNGEFHDAMKILQELHHLDRNHLPTLLLLACACYSLGRHDLSIFYNNSILELDSSFAEAYSNLGTTYRALASSSASSSSSSTASSSSSSSVSTASPSLSSSSPPSQSLKPSTTLTMNIHARSHDIDFSSPDSHKRNYCSSRAHSAPTSSPSQPKNSSTYYSELAEKYYKTAITLRPHYWDAGVNLTGLLSSQGRIKEAVEVCKSMEKANRALEFKMLSSSILLPDIENLSALSSLIPESSSNLSEDTAVLHLLCKLESQRRFIQSKMLSNPSYPLISSDPNALISPERARDLCYTLGNLRCGIGDTSGGKVEYFKALAAVGIGEVVYNAFNREYQASSSQHLNRLSSSLEAIINPIVTPETSLLVWQKLQQPQGARELCQSSIPNFSNYFNSSSNFNTAINPTTNVSLMNGGTDYLSTASMNMNNDVVNSSVSNGFRPLESAYHIYTASILQTLARMAQDEGQTWLAISLYYISLGVYPTANVCNNIGILVIYLAYMCLKFGFFLKNIFFCSLLSSVKRKPFAGTNLDFIWILCMSIYLQTWDPHLKTAAEFKKEFPAMKRLLLFNPLFI